MNIGFRQPVGGFFSNLFSLNFKFSVNLDVEIYTGLKKIIAGSDDINDIVKILITI